AIPACLDSFPTRRSSDLICMGIFANYPIAIAPGMGLNAYFASVVATQGVTYQVVLGTVFLAGIIFILLSLTQLRETLIKAIPPRSEEHTSELQSRFDLVC